MSKEDAMSHLTPMQREFIKASTERETTITLGTKKLPLTLKRWTLSESLTIAPLHAKIMSKVLSACPSLISQSERDKLEGAVDEGGDAEVKVSLDKLVADTYLWETSLGEISEELMTFVVTSLKHNDVFKGNEVRCREYIDNECDLADIMEVLLKASVLNKIEDTAKKKYQDLVSLYHMPS